ncbi:MAG TPA: HEAT repeat domain-containing protein, partial [Planctomycetota bacterium]|nr:HEAT repeat domain-containing protein [Planctomycetota bacterium]
MRGAVPGRAWSRVAAAFVLLCAGPSLAARAEDPKPRPVDALIAELGSQFGKNREKAAREIGLHGPAAAKAVPALVKALKDAYEPVRLPAALSLSRIDPSELSGVPLLIHAPYPLDPPVRVAVIEALCVYPPDVPGVVDELLRSVSSESIGPIAFARLRALGPAVLPNLNAMLEEGEPVRVRTIWPMVVHFGLEVVPSLLPLLESPDEQTRLRVATHLSKDLLHKYPPEIKKGIQVVLEGAPKPEFEAAVDGLAKEGAAVVPPLLAVLASTESAAVRVHAIRVLERIGAAARPAARRLRVLTVAFDPGVRDAAMAALWKIDPKAMEEPAKPIVPPAAWAAARAAKGRAKGVSRADEIEPVVEAALDWLIAHQEPNGLWGNAASVHRCRIGAGPCRGGGLGYLSHGTSALAILALLGNGETHASGKRADAVRKGLQALIDAQDSEGC